MTGKQKVVNVGVGFVTGRKSFKNVAQAYLKSWRDAGAMNPKKFALHLFVAYDLKYKDTKASDYQIAEDEILGLVTSAYYINTAAITAEANRLLQEKVIAPEEAKLLFGEGYAKKRNAVLYFALKHKMDYLVFFDDDEYPVAVLREDEGLVWKGQDALSAHLQSIGDCDITHGYHCGYISPIPCLTFNETLPERVFQTFIECISNDILSWESVREKMENGGVTYANRQTLESPVVDVVRESNGMKFISGANLGLNLKDRRKLFPFYNPPGARGEDTFLSTCLGDCTIRKIPSYTFHDGFLAYQSILQGVLPNRLKQNTRKTDDVVKHFLQACVGWIRYKPLLLYITNRESYGTRIASIREGLRQTLPAVSRYFGESKFMSLLEELDFYDGHVVEHNEEFQRLKAAWLRLLPRM